MNHLPDLIKDLGFILMTAAVVSIIFKKLKQPVVLGYLLAGFFLGPHFPFFVTVRDTKSIHIWAEIGVIILLFGLGLEFSLRKLTSIGKSAGITAFFEVPLMMALGFGLGKTFEWSNMDCLYLGGIMAISSTTIIVRAFDELRLKGKKFVSLVFGVLIFEDLIAILMLVMLTTIATSEKLSGGAFVTSVFKLGFYLVIWFLAGIYLIPLFLNRVRQYLNPETTVVVSLGLCLLMVTIVTHVGFSAPLGAFIMGAIIAETKDAKNFENIISPIKDLFGAIFFVSVGMLINPKMLLQNFNEVIIISLVLMFGKILLVSVGSMLSGQSLKTSFYAGMSMAQIGEFSFIIASLGLSLKVSSEFLYPVAVTVSALTSFTTPYLIKASPTVFEFLSKRLPHGFIKRIENYQTALTTPSEISLVGLLWRAYGIKISLNLIIVLAIALLTQNILMKAFMRYVPETFHFSGVSAIIALFLSAPFLWGIINGSPSHSALTTLKSARRLNSLLVGVTIGRFILGIIVVLALITHFTEIKGSYFIAFIVLSLLTLFFRRSIEPFYQSIENRFMENLTAREREEIELQKLKPNLAPWDATMTEFIVSPDSIVVGKSLLESKLKEQFGVTIALIERGSKKIIAPSRDEIVMPFDILYLIGSENELNRVKVLLEHLGEQIQFPHTHFSLESLMLSEHSPFIHKSIRDCGLREVIEGLIVGIERNGKRHLNPDSGMTLLPQDLLWVVANTEKFKKVSSQNTELL
jgi:CPA2 family monovalent cation:H+ antiporter-2